MSSVNCSECGKFVLTDIEGMCEDCHRENEMMVSVIKDFILTKGGVNLLELTAATGIPTKKILNLIRKGRLQIPTGGR